MPFGLYIHIPYCISKCRYCDFYSFGGNRSVPEEYIDALVRELWRHSPCGSTPLRPDTVYLGGGTPSLLTPAQVTRLLSTAGPLPGAEITLEANPGDLTPENLDSFLKAGVNRLSIGVQTADDESLKRLGRRHTASQARAAIRAAKAAGFANISGDLMLALPGYTKDECRASIALLAEEGVTHVSSYLLKLEENTAFAVHPPKDLPSGDTAAEFYLFAVEELDKAGYRQYEISNFAVPGYESRHNMIYWHCDDYLGVGPAAHSCIGGKRFFYPTNLKEFLAGPPPLFSEGECDATDYIMLRLRLAQGLDLEALDTEYGIVWGEDKRAFLRQCAQAGLCTFDEKCLKLLPKGMLVQNSILCRLL
ncbi:MAG: radical SAM family heme chaperone HemW [Oscillospiraceae bacterium]|nr:radical SAM family heme chaperone HemW [Oscillospiraceae bacterium]